MQWPTPPRKPLAWYLEQQDTIRTRTREIIRTLNDPEMAIPCKGQTFTLRWLLHHVLTHEAYHGGQAVLLALQWHVVQQGQAAAETTE